MFARIAAWSVLSALACAPPGPPLTTPPAAPVLEGAPDLIVTSLMNWTLKGSAPDDTLVRIHLDDACRGAVLADLTPQQLRDGFPIELVGGPLNVFTARAIDSRGVPSECSNPVSVRYDRPPPPQTPQAQALPSLPTRETRFVIRGTAPHAVTVRLFEGYPCHSQPLASLSLEDFTVTGFTVDLAPNGFRTFSLDALNAGNQRSPCAPPLQLSNDQRPPVVDPRLRSPTPSPEFRAWVSISSDDAEGSVFMGAGCLGSPTHFCSGNCSGFQIDFPAHPSNAWSAWAADSLGNRSDCVDSEEPWLFDPNVPVPPVELMSGLPLRALVPASNTNVHLYEGPDCDPSLLSVSLLGRDLISSGVYPSSFFGPIDGGVVTAQGSDGVTLFPCSAPVTRY